MSSDFTTRQMHTCVVASPFDNLKDSNAHILGSFRVEIWLQLELEDHDLGIEY